ncbi:MAG: hypothetical protein BAJALOKI2v1_610022 [Promethearchaeota archaeon]|nr:MAG: hypothetical protein BAJALOKI2v1_610022 [Candidatus Lokiarchaeota archaeon]
MTVKSTFHEKYGERINNSRNKKKRPEKFRRKMIRKKKR